jgi:Glutamyl-tRNAGlu reductase, dimerisation domain/Glutamyl-tRNAGlu reductase, N-terminal domain/Shikimate / quinate 5-dehydrogenase
MSCTRDRDTAAACAAASAVRPVLAAASTRSRITQSAWARSAGKVSARLIEAVSWYAASNAPRPSAASALAWLQYWGTTRTPLGTAQRAISSVRERTRASSMAMGEEHIVAQVKAAQQDAAAAGATGPVLTGLVETALRASKRVRSETTIGAAGISLVRIGLGLAREHLGGELTGRDAVVVGTGSVGKLAARLLREAGAGRLSIASRTEAKATELAQAVAGEPLPGVALVDLAALGRHLAAAGTPDHVSQARAIVSAEVAAYLTRQQQAAAAPVIAALHAQIRQLADAELARLQDRLPGLDDKQRADMAATVHRILRKVLHRPTVRAKELSTGPARQEYLEALRQLFELPPPRERPRLLVADVHPSHLGTAAGRGDGPTAEVPVMRIWASRVRASADDAKGQAWRAAALQQLGELMPVEVVGVGLGQWPGDAEPGEL